MDALLLEKAETQQSLALARKDLEKTKQQAKVKMTSHGIFFQWILKLIHADMCIYEWIFTSCA